VFIKILADNLPVAEIGESESLRLGHKTISIGNNFRDSQSFSSSGIISSLNSIVNSGLNEEKLDNMVKVDCILGDRNNGGPLIDFSGKVMGVIIETEDRGNYVVPVDRIKKPMDDIINDKTIERLKLGIRYIELSPNVSIAKDITRDYGLYLPEGVDSVIPDGPANKAGIESGDIIYKISNKDISEKQNLQKILEEYEIGDEVEVTYLRDGKEEIKKIVLGE
jgi:serine protease Do